MKDGHRQGAAAGFTIIEAMISMFFIAFIVGEMAMVANYGRRASAFARRVTEANMIAEGMLEKSRNTAYTNLNTPFSALDTPADPIMFDLTRDGALESYSETCVPSPPTATTVVSTCTAAVGVFTVTRTISPVIPAVTTAFKDSIGAAVDIVVTWTVVETSGGSKVNVPKEVRVSTIRSRY